MVESETDINTNKELLGTLSGKDDKKKCFHFTKEMQPLAEAEKEGKCPVPFFSWPSKHMLLISISQTEPETDRARYYLILCRPGKGQSLDMRAPRPIISRWCYTCLF